MRFDIEDWVSRMLPDLNVNATGQAVGECPFCGKQGRFYVAVTGGKIGSYICFKCDERGRNPVGLIAHVEGLSRGEAQRLMMKDAELFRRRQETAESLVDRIRATRGLDAEAEPELVDFDLPEGFIPVFKEGRKPRWKFPVYLKERGVTKAAAREWGLGWCRSGVYAERLVVPVNCPNGRSFTARDMSGDQEPKYRNPAGADHSRLLLGWDHVKLSSDIAIVEGPLDVIKAWQAGIPVIGLMGKNLSPHQLALLMKKPPDCSITVMLDPEEVEAPYDIAADLSTYFEHVAIARLPDGKDPGNADPVELKQVYGDAKKHTGRSTSKLEHMLGASRKKMEGFYQS